MYNLLKAALPVRLNIIFVCCIYIYIDICIKVGHYFDFSAIGSYLAKNILISENYQNTTKSMSICLNEQDDSEK